MQLASLRKVILIALFFYLPYQSMAWGILGHRIVGEIADSYLTPQARHNIYKILGTESLAMAANWADFIKADTTYKYLNNWHYADLDEGMSYDDVANFFKQDTAVDAYTKINFLTKELKKKTLSKADKVFYLRLLIHFVGDIHQPEHVGRKSDLGGNTIKVTWFGESSNLHRVWDEQLIEGQKLSYTEYTKAINHVRAPTRWKWIMQPMTQWFYESYQISEQLHNEIKQKEPKLGYLYNFEHLASLNERLLKGGVRLAGLLNEIFK